MILDNGAALEGYPLFADATGTRTGLAPDLTLAPRVFDLHRSGDATTLRGELRRRVMRRADTCDARASIVVATCAADALELELADAPLPLTLAPCTWPALAPAHREHWTRE